MSEHRRLKLKRREHRKKKQEDKRTLEQLATPLPDKVPEDSGHNRVYSVKVLPMRAGESFAGPLSEEERAALDAEIEAKGEHFYITAADIRRSP